MPTTIAPPESPFQREPPDTPVRWTRHQAAELVDKEILQGRYELIDGEIISKMGQKPPHAYVIKRINAWLVRIFGGDFVSIQLPIDVAEQDNLRNEPEPDATVLAHP